MSVHWSLPIRCDIIDILLNYVIANRMIELKCLIMNQNIYDGISLALQINVQVRWYLLVLPDLVVIKIRSKIFLLIVIWFPIIVISVDYRLIIVIWAFASVIIGIELIDSRAVISFWNWISFESNNLSLSPH